MLHFRIALQSHLQHPNPFRTVARARERNPEIRLSGHNITLDVRDQFGAWNRNYFALPLLPKNAGQCPAYVIRRPGPNQIDRRRFQGEALRQEIAGSRPARACRPARTYSATFRAAARFLEGCTASPREAFSCSGSSTRAESGLLNVGFVVSFIVGPLPASGACEARFNSRRLGHAPYPVRVVVFVVRYFVLAIFQSAQFHLPLNCGCKERVVHHRRPS